MLRLLLAAAHGSCSPDHVIVGKVKALLLVPELRGDVMGLICHRYCQDCLRPSTKVKFSGDCVHQVGEVVY